MAKSAALGLAILFVALITAPAMVRSNSAEPKFTLYTHPIEGVNIVPVAGPYPPRKNMFGDIEVLDVPATQSISSDAPPDARLQGIDVYASIDGTQIYAAFSIIFEQGKHKGSTLQLQGSTRTGELSVTGGTKTLRFSRGYVEVQTVRQGTNTTGLELKIFLKEYDH